MNISRSLLLAALPLLMVSCADDIQALFDTPIRLQATQKEATTRADNDIQTTTFEEGETLNGYFEVTGSNESLGKAPVTLTATAPNSNKNDLVPDVQVYYPQTGTVDIYALYPPTKATKGMTSFTVEADQRTNDNYKLSDLMWAGVTAQAKTTADVALQFSHKMAKLAVTITGIDSVLIKKVTMISVNRAISVTNAKQGLLATDATVESNASNKRIVIAQTDDTDDKGKASLSGAILFPQQTISGNFLEIETNFGTTWFSTDKRFLAGSAYSASLKVTRQQIGSITSITDWVSNGASIAVPPGSSAGLKITPIENITYDGFEQRPPLEITYTPNEMKDSEGNVIESQTYHLVQGKDFIANYFNNTNIGTATVIIEGEAYTGSESPKHQVVANLIGQIRAITSFNITEATGELSYKDENLAVEYKYNETIDNPLNKNGGDGQFTYESTKPEVATVSESGTVTIRKVGTTVIKAHMDNTGNYTAADAEYTLTVKPRNIKTAASGTDPEIVITLSSDEYVYTGQAYTPAVTVTDNGRVLLKDTHYTVAYSNNTNAGTATVTVKGVGNYDSSDAAAGTKTFTIKKGTPVITLSSTTDVTLPINFSVTRRATTTLGTIKYESDAPGVAKFENGVVTAVAEGTTTVRAKVEETGNFYEKSQSFKVKVVKSYWSYGYTGTVQKWTCPLTGVYQLEALGAQGGTYGGFVGGRGAQIAGQLKVQEGQVLYIYVGQQGVAVNQTGATQGGWNGGGTYAGSNTSTSEQTIYCGGGGATDFALQGTEGATAWNNSNHLNSRILVAGGGGGALYRVYPSNGNFKFTGGGGGGGAYVGETGYGGSKPGSGGTLSGPGTTTSGGSQTVAAGFGYGGNYNGTLSAGMGGGGWYGGASGGYDAANEDPANLNFSRGGSGGGGSSYIWNSNNATYYAGHGSSGKPITTGSKETDATKFYITPTILTEGASPGNGEARITYMGEDE